MKNKRLNGWFLHAILILAVLFSVVFTALIWVTPVYFQRLAGMAAPDKTKVVNEDTNTTDKKKLTDVYRPVSITVTDKRSSSRLLSNRIDVVNLMMTSLEGSKITDISKPETVSKSEYLKLVQTPRSYQLNYGSELSFGVLKQYLAEQPAKSENYSFDRIVISYDGSTVYFLEDAGLKVYKAKLTKYAKAKLNNVHKTKGLKRYKLSYEYQNGRLIQYYEDPITVPRYSYLYNKENVGMYVTRLLGAEKSSTSSLTTREQDGVPIYSEKKKKKLSIRDKTGLITYTDYLTDETGRQNWTLDDHLTNDFTDLEQLGVSLADVKYSEYDIQEKNVIYRSYIDGFPVISARDFGTYQIQNRVRSKKLVFSQCSLQVPVPAAGKAVTLKPTKEILPELQNADVDLSKISDIQIGYTVSQNGTASLVIDLTPTYFVKYNNVWINYQDLVSGKKWGDNDNEF